MSGIFSFTKEKQVNKVVELPVELIKPNPDQPRKSFDDDDIIQLAESIEQNGILQPLSVRRNKDSYELIAGERRLKAAKLCGLETVPCIIHDVTSENSAVLSLVENIQRKDLSFFDEAMAIEKLIKYYGLTQDQAAAKLGRAQSTIANKLRLLRLTDTERSIIINNNMTERHARALLRIASPENRLEVLEKIVKYSLNVERAEQVIDEYIKTHGCEQPPKKKTPIFQNVNAFINVLNKALLNMKSAGIEADSHRFQTENYIEYRVRIPINKK